MQIESKFRKLFWARIGTGFLLFIITVYLCLNSISQYSRLIKNPVFIVSFIFILFFFFAALDLLRTFKLIITDQGIEKILLISGQKQYIPFTSIIGIERRKIRMQTKSGYLTDGYSISIIKLENNRTLVVSPDNFENYDEIMFAIKNKLA